MEQRLLLTNASPEFNAYIDDAETLHILGTEADERIIATVDRNEETVSIRQSGPESSDEARFSLNEFTRIHLDAGAGDDFVNIVDAGRTLDERSVTLDLSGGDGDNFVFLTTAPANEMEAEQLKLLANASAELEDIAQQLAATTQAGLVEQTMDMLDGATSRIIDVTASLSDDLATSSSELADGLLGQTQSELLDMAQDVLSQIEEVGTQATELSVQFESTMMSQGGTEDTPPENPDALEAALAEQEQQFIALTEEVESLGEEASGFGDSTSSVIDESAADLESRGDDILAKADALMRSTEGLSSDLESGATKLGDRVLQVSERLNGLNQLLLEALDQYTDEITAAAEATRSSSPEDEVKCKVNAKHTFAGGNGFDFFLPTSAPTSSWKITGGGGTDILFGGLAADDISGGDGLDLIFGLRGDDLIHGDDGTDLLFGEFVVEIPLLTGNDCVYGDDGIDLVVGDNGFELFSSNPGGDDDLHGGDGIDIIIGDDIQDIFNPTHAGGKDTINGDDGIDALFGTGGEDTVNGGKQIDFMMGGGGNDTLYGIDTTFTGDGWKIPGTSLIIGNLQLGNLDDDTIYGGDGIDIQLGNAGKDTMRGKKHIDLMFGSADQDTMYGESGGEIVPGVRFGNIMRGDQDKDTMWGGGDLDVMSGGTADDTMHGFDGNIEPLGLDIDVMLGGDGDDTMAGDAEQLLLLTSVDFMFGQNGDDTMDGGSQLDLMLGGNGDDTMRGDSNSLLRVLSIDVMFGGDGNDDMDGGNATDIMFGQDGNDTMQGDDNSFGLISLDLMLGGRGDDSMNGGSGIDLMFGQDGNDTMRGDDHHWWQLLSFDLMFGGKGCDLMYGGQSLDLMFGNAGVDTINGQRGSDLIFGGADSDIISGGRGWDAIFGNSGTDVIHGDRGLDFVLGGSEDDRIFGDNGVDLLLGGRGNDLIRGGNDVDLILGGAEDDCLYGESHTDLIFGGRGKDCIRGGNGTDFLVGGVGDDRIFGEAGSDAAFGGWGNDSIDGGSRSDFLSGGAGHDRLWGGSGSDFILGGSGNDTLIGGAGWDILIGGFGWDSRNQRGPNSSGLTCICVHAPVDPCVKYDFGDAPDSYGTTLSSGARHVMTGPRLGNRVDWERDGQPSFAANGDNLSGINDEDGVAVSTLYAGIATPVAVKLTNASSAFLNAWVDSNSNGVFDSSEQVATNVPIVAGTNTVNIPLPASAAHGTTYARFRVSTVGGLAPTGAAPDGEVEDYQIRVHGRDFGDAPDSYGTLQASSGPWHTSDGPILGATIDVEPNGQPAIGALGDDSAYIDDEDGVVLSGMVSGGTATAAVHLSAMTSAYLDAWVDFNQNGVFDPSEQIFTGTTITGGSNSLSFPVPATATLGSTYARFRVSTTAGGLLPTGPGGSGEVEDYSTSIETGLDFGDAPDSYGTLLASNGARHTTGGPVLGSLIDVEPNGQPGTGATLDNSSGVNDEDGVTLSSMTQGGVVTANVVLSSASTAMLSGWVDFDQSGVFDPGEQIFVGTPINSGSNLLTFPVPAMATPGNTYARFRIGSDQLMSPLGYGGDGEVEDYQVSIEKVEYDFADAPDSYGTLLASNGARHTLGGPVLGPTIDIDPDGQPSMMADGDDILTIDDEDGVIVSASRAFGGTAQVSLNWYGNANLDAWLDFNQDGLFSGTAEYIFNSVLISPGVNTLTFPVPTGALQGATYARFRISEVGVSSPVGYGGPGEVEDYILTVTEQSNVNDEKGHEGLPEKDRTGADSETTGRDVDSTRQAPENLPTGAGAGSPLTSQVAVQASENRRLTTKRRREPRQTQVRNVLTSSPSMGIADSAMVGTSSARSEQPGALLEPRLLDDLFVAFDDDLLQLLED